MLAALLVTGFLILNSSGSFNPFEQRMNLKARFKSADGLHKGADVQLAGVSVGKVEDVKFLPPDSPAGERIEATLSVVEEFQDKPITELIRSDSTAQLVGTSVLGNDKLINITPGTTNASPVDANAVLTSSAAVGFNELTAAGTDVMATAQQILDKANRGDGTLGRIVNDERLYEDLDQAVAETRDTMTQLQVTIGRINEGKGSAGKLLNDPTLYNNLNSSVQKIESIMTDIRAGRGSAGKFINDDALYIETKNAVTELKVTAQKMSLIADDVKLITADIREGRGTVGKLFTDETFFDETKATINQFNKTAVRIDQILEGVQAGKGTVGKLMNDEQLYNDVSITARNVATFSGEATKLLEDFRKDPKKFLTIKLNLF